MNLSKNFTLQELTRTNTGIPNIPNLEQISKLADLVTKILQPLRDLYGNPITVTSGYRSLAVNTKIGGASSSQHTKGEAADIKGFDNALLFKLIKDNFLFDQLIWEFGNEKQPDWVHVSFKNGKNRKQILKAVKVGKSTKYLPM